MTRLGRPVSLETAWLTEMAARLDPDRSAAVKPMTFREYVDKVRPGYVWYRHCVVLAAILQRVADGEIKRLMVFMPPRHGKSELVSRLFTGYFLYRYPHWWVGLACYGSDLAEDLSREAREFYKASGGPLSTSTTAVRKWHTGRGGGMWAAGIGGPITGRGMQLGILDDVVKNAEEAGSEVIQKRNYGWYGSAFYTREEPWSESDPNSPIINVQTRWNELDLAGKLLAEQGDDEDAPRDKWHIVSMEAIKEEEPPKLPATCTLEPDWRQPGEALCPERRPLHKLLRIARAIGSYAFAALFQQRPAPAEGGMFKAFPVVHAVPDGCKFVRYWDKAGTAGGLGARTAGVKMARTREGVYIIVHVVKGRWSAGEREKVIRETTVLDGHQCHVWVEQEPGSGGKESAENTVLNLEGYVCFIERVTGDKPTRAQPMAAQSEVGNIKLLEGEWNQDFVDEARVFPNGRYKDQIDAAGGAFNKLALEARPIPGAAVAPVMAPPVPAFTGQGGVPEWDGNQGY